MNTILNFLKRKPIEPIELKDQPCQLIPIPEGLFKNIENIPMAFSFSITQLTSIPEGLFDNIENNPTVFSFSISQLKLISEVN